MLCAAVGQDSVRQVAAEQLSEIRTARLTQLCRSGRYRLKENALGRVICRATGISPDSEHGKALVQWKAPEAGTTAGNFAEVAREVGLSARCSIQLVCVWCPTQAPRSTCTARTSSCARRKASMCSR